VQVDGRVTPSHQRLIDPQLSRAKRRTVAIA